jgi:hypothetical protein
MAVFPFIIKTNLEKFSVEEKQILFELKSKRVILKERKAVILLLVRFVKIVQLVIRKSTYLEVAKWALKLTPNF